MARYTDIQSANTLDDELEYYGLSLTEDGYVRWNDQNPAHPRNWGPLRKLYNTGVVLLLELITTAISTAGTTAADHAQQDYGFGRSYAIFAFTSMYLVGQAVGSIFFPPYSETFGRKTLYTASTLAYAVSCIVVAVVPSLGLAVIARFVGGVLSAIPTIVVAGSIEDLFDMEQRITMVFLWALIGNMGLVLGPMYSAYITYSLGWRWVFYISAIIMAFFFLLCLGLRESRPSILLEQHVSMVRELEPGKKLLVRNPDKVKDFRTLVRITLIRPLRLLCTEPIIMIVSFIGSVVNTIFYLFVEAFPVVYDDFGFSERQASLIFIGIGAGLCFGFFPRMYDRHVIKIRQKKGQVLEPEDKLFGFALATPLLAISLWWFAWTVPPYTHTSWIVSAFALVPAGFALNELCYTLEGYLADSYTIYAASAFAGFSLSRSLVGAVVMPFAHQMYSGLSANIASSILASVATCFCAASYILIKHGYEIRGRSSFAKYSLEIYQQNQIGDDMNLAHAA